MHRKYASKGVMDLICITAYLPEGCEVLYVQCKTNKYIHPKERAALIEHANSYGGRAILAYKDAKRHIAIELLN